MLFPLQAVADFTSIFAERRKDWDEMTDRDDCETEQRTCKRDER